MSEADSLKHTGLAVCLPCLSGNSRSLAAAIEGDLGGKPDLDFSRVRRSPLAYAGDGEMFLALLQHTAAQAGAEFHVIPDANHMSAFASMKKVAPFVDEYLRRVS